MVVIVWLMDVWFGNICSVNLAPELVWFPRMDLLALD